ncbi:MAG: hypothetical protein AAFP82_03475, partial [Bacteroidota bacterium]
MKYHYIFIALLLATNFALAQQFPDFPPNSSQPILIKTKNEKKATRKSRTSIIWIASELLEKNTDKIKVSAVIKSKEKIDATQIQLLLN